ncbi:MAG TPA: UPF0175 family protein [Anaerolineales bacterium]|nr:UPF0175 family protein [Anaerolineales bacterium]
MTTLTVEASNEIAAEVRHYEGRLREIILLGILQLKTQEALALYSKGLVSLVRAAEMAGVSRQEMIRQARAARVQPRWSDKMVEAELA